MELPDEKEGGSTSFNLKKPSHHGSSGHQIKNSNAFNRKQSSVCVQISFDPWTTWATHSQPAFVESTN